MEVTMADKVTTLTISQEMGVRAMKHVQECTVPPPESTREDMMAYQYLVWKENEKLLREKADLARRKELADESSARRAAYSFSSSGQDVTQRGKRPRSRINLTSDAERDVATRNLDSSLMTEDADGIPVPKIAAGAFMSLSTYLRATQPPEGDPRAAVHRQQIQALRLAEEALLIDAEPREDRNRHDRERAAREDRPTRHLQEGEDARNYITQKTVDRNRSKRPVNTPTEELYWDNGYEPCGLNCFN